MSISPGYLRYQDDRDPSIVEMIQDNNEQAIAKWHEVSRIDSNQITRSYLFSEKSYNSYLELMSRHDEEFEYWLNNPEED